MEYLVYVSDSKIELLFEQIPWSSRERLAFEIGIDLAVFKANFKNLNVENSRAHKIKMIKRFISKDIGSIDTPKKYFSGELEMRWGPFEKYENLVFFGGRTENSYVGLGGSLTNCPQFNSSALDVTSYSFTPYLVSALAKKKEVLDPHSGFTNSRKAKDINDAAMEAVLHSNTLIGLPTQKLKFLAKKVVNGYVKGENVVIGSPLYVEQLD